LAKVVHTTVDIGVLRTVQLRQSVDDTVGFLRGGGVVEIYQRIAEHFSAQYREVFPYLLDIEFHFLFFSAKIHFFYFVLKSHRPISSFTSAIVYKKGCPSLFFDKRTTFTKQFLL